jgi:hypothetical protein
MKPLVPGENQNRNENESGRQESRPDGKPLHGTTNYVTYEDDQPEGHLTVWSGVLLRLKSGAGAPAIRRAASLSRVRRLSCLPVALC